MDKEALRREWSEEGYKLDDCTCNDCPDNTSCPFAFDLYNTHGDCLAIK